jgi:ABC-type lipoprotein release transport system permease subunit
VTGTAVAAVAASLGTINNNIIIIIISSSSRRSIDVVAIVTMIIVTVAVLVLIVVLVVIATFKALALDNEVGASLANPSSVTPRGRCRKHESLQTRERAPGADSRYDGVGW